MKKLLKIGAVFGAGLVILAVHLRTLMSRADFERPVLIKYIIIAAAITAVCTALYFISFRLPVGKCFLVSFLSLGIIYMLTVPIFRGADENMHFFRIYEISQGHITTSVLPDGRCGRYLPKSLTSSMNGDLSFYSGDNVISYSHNAVALKIPLNPEDTEFVEFAPSALYSPITYLPHVIGMLIPRLVGAPPIVLALFARIFNMLAFALLGYIALRLLPYAKRFFLVLMLTPMALHCATTLSGDAFICGISLVWMAYILNLRESQSKISRQNITVLSVLMLTIALCKVAYLPICLMFFLVPSTKFKSRKKYIFTFIAMFFAATLINVGWNLFASRYLVETRPGVDGSAQLSFILHNLWLYPFIVILSFARNITQMLMECAGLFLCVSDVVPDNGIGAMLNIFIFTGGYFLLTEIKPRKPFSLFEKLLGAFVITGTIGLVLTALYLQWTQVGHLTIAGIQGRYFVPLLPLLTIFGGSLRFQKSKGADKFNAFLIPLMIWMHIFPMLDLFTIHFSII